MLSQMTISDVRANQRLFDTMYRDRKKVFVDMLKWNIPHDGERETDKYDNEDARYLILRDKDTGRHLGSVRLLPSTADHMLSEVFSFLCEGQVPVGNSIWEITRLVVSPDIDRRDRLIVRNMLGRGMIEFGLLTGIDFYTCVCEMGFLSQLLASGWKCEPLGIPQLVDGAVIGALKIKCDTSSLARTRANWRYASPALRLTEFSQIAA